MGNLLKQLGQFVQSLEEMGQEVDSLKCTWYALRHYGRTHKQCGLLLFLLL